jgi:hypothetical protein
MKKLLFFIAICGLMLMGAENSAYSLTMNVTFDFNPVTCPAWCCYAWRMRVYEYNPITQSRVLIDTEYRSDCDIYSYTYSETIDYTSGYTYIYGIVDAVGSTVCDPAPPYQNWSSGLTPVTGADPDWKPKIC